jgi:hypothetical protein
MVDQTDQMLADGLPMLVASSCICASEVRDANVVLL